MCGAYGGSCLSFSLRHGLCAPQINTHTHTHTHTRQKSWHTHWDGTKPSLQQRTEPQRGWSLRCLLVFPPADPHGYRHSPTQSSHMETGRKPREGGEWERQGAHLWLWSERWANISSSSSSHLHPTAAYVASLWLRKTLLERPNSTQSHQNKRGIEVATVWSPEWLIRGRSAEWIA